MLERGKVVSERGDMLGFGFQHTIALCCVYVLALWRFSLVTPSNVGTDLEAVLGGIQTNLGVLLAHVLQPAFHVTTPSFELHHACDD